LAWLFILNGVIEQRQALAGEKEFPAPDPLPSVPPEDAEGVAALQ
jgi:hypothetical protein